MAQIIKNLIKKLKTEVLVSMTRVCLTRVYQKHTKHIKT